MASLINDLLQTPLSLSHITAPALLILTCLFLLSIRRPTPPAKAPKLLSFFDNYPIVGATRFFTSRLAFFHDGMRASKTGNFSFWIGKNFIIGLSGDESRRVFFQSSQLGMAEGYVILFGGGPRVKNDQGSEVVQEAGFARYFLQRTSHLLRRECITRNISPFVHDIEARLDELPTPTGMTDPFVTIYQIVFQLTMRQVGCYELASDIKKLKHTLSLYEAIEKSTNAINVIFPWLPTPALIRRSIAGGQLYFSISGIINDRKKTGRREDDALQHLIDMGDDMNNMLQFSIGVVFAGLQNTGINAAYLLAYIGTSRYWCERVRAELDGVLDKYAPDHTMSLTERFALIPIEGWETEMPLLDNCLRETIRLQLGGTMYRRNISGSDVMIGNEVIPSGAFAAYQVSDIHQDPEVYPEPLKWDPGRYLPDRAEDKRKPFAYVGWGRESTHLAKLEQFTIVAVFLTRFDFDTCDDKGVPYDSVPPPDLDAHASVKPKFPVRLRYKPREWKV
ncbi:cytochrome P450 [Bisporella sp. PMI_857]|nr:cytochrome P450 [Bisporella sp. PMI_857]